LIILPILISLGGCLNALEQEHPGAVLTILPNQRGNTSQILMVTEEHSLFSTQIMVRALEWREQAWHTAFGPLKAVIGRKGFAPPGEKREGDGRTPSGVFPLPLVFGYGASAPTRMPYRQAREEDLWVDDPASPDYNRWVVRGETAAASFERLKRDDDLYKYGIVIAYNTDPVINGHGSAIFLHLWRGPESTTAGCVALAEADVLKILAWLEPSANPVIILRPADP
jgi:L,D-peptidoglycan transpeptidase YkuD (ErfK/YbiS/YcfS/YnhG family)